MSKPSEYINILSKEQTFISYQGEEIPLEVEEEYIQKLLQKFENNEAIHLLALSGGRIIGTSDLHMMDQSRGAIKHNGHFGISVLKEYRSRGLGKLLMKLVLDEAIKNLPNLRIITLGVFAINESAINLYKSFGFIEYGKLPEAFSYKGKYIDEIRMYKKVK